MATTETKVKGGFSPQTLQLFAQLLSQVQLSAAADDLEAQATVVTQAKKELVAELEKLKN